MLLLSDGAMQSLVKALQSYFAVLRQATPSYDTTHLHLQLQPSISNPFRLKAHLLPSKWPITPFCERIYEVVSYIATSSGRAVHQWLATHSYRTFPSTILILHWCVRLSSPHPPRNQIRGGPKRNFRRRSLPYHLVQRCRRRVGNRPPRVVGGSRNMKAVAAHHALRRQRRQARELEEALKLYDSYLSMPAPAPFSLHEPDIRLIEPLISRLDVGGVPSQCFKETSH